MRIGQLGSVVFIFVEANVFATKLCLILQNLNSVNNFPNIVSMSILIWIDRHYCGQQTSIFLFIANCTESGAIK